MKTKYHIGCSGFHYKHWKGVFYPEKLAQSKWIDFYCQHFSTLELNVTFYRFPQLSFLQTWHRKSPPHFTFSVKAPRIITHYKQFNEIKQLIDDLYKIIQEGLEEKLSCILFQLPPRMAYSEEKLKKIVDSLDTSFQNVLEFRNISWWRDEVYDFLRANKICFCGMSHPALPQEIISNTGFIYYRFHGVPHLYKSPYELSVLQNTVDKIRSFDKLREAFIYFNNDIETSAVRNAKELIELI